MAYTTKEEIQADFKDLTFTTTSNVKIVDVEQFIIESDALINSYIGERYVVPVTTGEGLQLLKLYSRLLTTARIKKIMEVKQDKGQDANQNVVGVLMSPAAIIKALESIRDGKSSLVGATLLTNSGGFFNNNVSNDVEAVMKKDEKQW